MTLLSKKPLWFHILLALALVFTLLFLFVVSLNWITKHGESSTVPMVTGKKLDDVQALLEEKGFELIIQDSVFYDSIPRGMVLRQVPEADDVVKVNRTVYVTINRFIAPDIELPKLSGLSYRNAEMVIRNIGLKIGDTTFRTDFAKNTVLEVLYQGKSIQPGATIKVGTPIDLVIGSGVGNEAILVPKLMGLTYEEARALLDAQGIILGAPIFMPGVQDSANAYVYRQRPAPTTLDGKRLTMRAGQMIDIWLQIEKPNVDSLEKAAQPPPANEPNEY
ncbi:MAG: PASTA domain-containing protein [Chitinophagaceae bacterium]|nr:MAG: PASTA domain-containing protein [Chitinophagaceae bacterium]